MDDDLKLAISIGLREMTKLQDEVLAPMSAFADLAVQMLSAVRDGKPLSEAGLDNERAAAIVAACQKIDMTSLTKRLDMAMGVFIAAVESGKIKL